MLVLEPRITLGNGRLPYLAAIFFLGSESAFCVSFLFSFQSELGYFASEMLSSEAEVTVNILAHSTMKLSPDPWRFCSQILGNDLEHFINEKNVHCAVTELSANRLAKESWIPGEATLPPFQIPPPQPPEQHPAQAYAVAFINVYRTVGAMNLYLLNLKLFAEEKLRPDPDFYFFFSLEAEVDSGLHF